MAPVKRINLFKIVQCPYVALIKFEYIAVRYTKYHYKILDLLNYMKMSIKIATAQIQSNHKMAETCKTFQRSGVLASNLYKETHKHERAVNNLQAAAKQQDSF